MDVPNVVEKCWHEAMNQQLQYETEQSLINELSQGYQNVNTHHYLSSFIVTVIIAVISSNNAISASMYI